MPFLRRSLTALPTFGIPLISSRCCAARSRACGRCRASKPSASAARVHSTAGGSRTPLGRARCAAFQGAVRGYWNALGTRLLEGRDFSDADIDSRRAVVIVDDRIAAELW